MTSPEGNGGERCVFCDIVNHRLPAHMIYEDAATAAFLDNYPFTRGHLLVVSKRHAARLTDLSWDDQMALIRTLDELCRRAERLSPDYNLSLNAGANAGQVVFHVHFHIIPRYGEANPFHVSPRPRLTDRDARALVAELAPT
ncbi:MAG TPA: HIT family protein [Thermoplasmata archaeon]|nr:HIT family protein [Thermoplasmata archaeon]HYB78602.1 HIT family protein [Thermoplasmata archaeon]